MTNMKRKCVKLKRRKSFKQILAGGLTAIISPLAAFSITANFDQISTAVNSASQYLRTSSSGTDLPQLQISTINNGALMLYSPAMPIDNHSLQSSLATPDFNQEAVAVMSRNISLEREDFSVFSSRDGVAARMTFKPHLSTAYLQLDSAGQVRNTTNIPDSFLEKEKRLPLSWQPQRNAQPQVLIIHTHTSESFLPSSDYYDLDYTFRSIDSSQNIVAVGAKIAEEIAAQGFAVIHDGTIHDHPVFSGAYKRSADTVKAILEEYPSIKIVLDIHRDGIEQNGKPVAAVAEINGREAAQIMIISAADDGNWGVPDFLENFRFACRLQSRLESDNQGLTRAVLFQYCNYNMHLSHGALLVEIGSHGNTLEQALYAGELFGQSIGRLLSELSE
jgi:stage II sporulation protein P